MSKVIFGMTMSLDVFVNDANGSLLALSYTEFLNPAKPFQTLLSRVMMTSNTKTREKAAASSAHHI